MNLQDQICKNCHGSKKRQSPFIKAGNADADFGTVLEFLTRLTENKKNFDCKSSRSCTSSADQRLELTQGPEVINLVRWGFGRSRARQ